MRFFSLCAIGLLGTSLWATRHGDLHENTKSASSIVLGEVTEARSYYGSDGEIYSDVTVSVSAVLKDQTNAAGSNLRTFTVKGGTVGDTHVIFTDVPRFETNEAFVLFFDGEAPREKYAIREGWVPELNQRSAKVLDAIEETLAGTDTPIVEGERRRARAFVQDLAASPSAAADAGCYVLIGPKWATSQATYKFNATIPAAWQTALASAASTWGAAGTVFNFKSDVASTNEFLVGPVSGASTLASTRIEYDSTMKMRKFTMTFSDAVQWSTSGEAGKFDVQGITTHELGHALGLNHPAGGACSEQTMWATAAAAETKKQTLEAGDKAGAGALYAASAAAITPPAPVVPPSAPVVPPPPPPAPVIPAPGFTTAYIFPTIPSAGQAFTIWLYGTGFNTSTVQIVITGPGCPAGCIVNPSYKQATLLSASATLSAKGSYTVAIRNGATGTLSVSKPFTVN